MKSVVQIYWVGTTVLASVSAMLLVGFIGRLLGVEPVLTAFVGFMIAVFVGETVLIHQIRRGGHLESGQRR
jgi:hypothetical protein